METFVIGDIVVIKPEWIDSRETADAEYMVIDQKDSISVISERRGSRFRL